MHFTFFSQAHIVHSPGCGHILGHKSNLGKFLKNELKNEIILSIFSDYNGVRLDISKRKQAAKKHKQMKAKQHASE